MDKIFCHSCESMSEIPDGEVSLVVTSPPYWNAIDYDQHVDDSQQNYRPRQSMDYREYLDWMSKVFAEVGRVLKPGGFCGVVIGTCLLDGTHVPLPFHLSGRLESLGLEFHQDIIWYKVTGGVKRARVAIQNPFPGYYYSNLMCEYILMFRKPGPKIYEDRFDDEKWGSQYPIDMVFKKDVANNIWHIAPVPPKQYPHPCPFPEEIPYRLIQLYSYKDELVLDPFAGIGTTLKVARNLGRRYVGYETKKEYIEVAKERIGEPLRLREQLIAEFNKVACEEDLGTEENFVAHVPSLF